MRFEATAIPGAWAIELEPLGDERGWFARSFDGDEFRAHGIELTVVQANTSFNARRGTIRGMHYQADPHGEPKLIWCTRGTIFDVGVDLRRESPAYCAWHAAELSESNLRMLYLPPGVAHGFQTLTADCQVSYLMGHRYVPEAACGVRFDDPAFDIAWPALDVPATISERDRAHPDFVP